MDYGFGKTFRLKDGFTALNGCVQYYKVTFANVDITVADDASDEAKAEAQANYLRALEVLRTYGGQPIITKAAGKVLEFTLEQANVYGENLPQQVSAKWSKDGEEKPIVNDFRDAAKAKIADLFANVKAVDGETSFAVAAENGVIIDEVLF